jgi:hypothetical protein
MPAETRYAAAGREWESDEGMPGLRRPQRKADLAPPPFVIGEPGWREAIISVLRAYDVPLPAPVREEEIAARERALGAALPAAVRRFLMEIGPVDFDYLRLFHADEIVPLEYAWLRRMLDEPEQRRLPFLLEIAAYSGSGDVVAIDRAAGRCGLCSHTPVRIKWWLRSFDDLIRVALIDLSWSYYGWPDPDVEALARALKQDLIGSELS